MATMTSNNYEMTIRLLTIVLLILIVVFLVFDSRRRRREIIEFITPLFGSSSSSNFPSSIGVYGNVGLTGPVQVVGNFGSIGLTGEIGVTGPVQVFGNVGLTGPIGIYGNVGLTGPVDIRGNVGLTGPVDIRGNVGLTGPVGITGTVNVVVGNTGPISVSSTGTTQIAFEPTATDAFARLRTSYPHTLFDSSFRYGDSFYYWNTLTTDGGSTSYLSNESAFNLSVPATNGAKVIRETKHVYAYQPGKSLLILCTFVMDGSISSSDLIQKVGYYGNEDGVYFKRQGDLNYFCIKTSTSGSQVETQVVQTSWSENKFPTLNVALTQILWFDIEWLGVGSVRCGFVEKGKLIHCHTFHHANEAGNTQVYMKSASLPVRYEIESTGTAGTLKQICSSIISEGGYTKVSVTRTVSTYNDSTTLIALTQNRFIPILSIRLKTGFMDAIIVPTSFDFYLTDNAKAAYWRFSINRKLTSTAPGSITWSSVTKSAVEYGILTNRSACPADLQLLPNDVDNGYILKEGFVIGGPKGGSISLKEGVNDFFGQISRSIANGVTTAVSDILTLSICATDVNNTAHAVLTYQEDTFTG